MQETLPLEASQGHKERHEDTKHLSRAGSDREGIGFLHNREEEEMILTKEQKAYASGVNQGEFDMMMDLLIECERFKEVIKGHMKQCAHSNLSFHKGSIAAVEYIQARMKKIHKGEHGKQNPKRKKA